MLDVSNHFRFVPCMFRLGMLRPGTFCLIYMFILVILKYYIHFNDFISTTVQIKVHVYLCCKRFIEQLAINSCDILQNIYTYKIQNI